MLECQELPIVSTTGPSISLHKSRNLDSSPISEQKQNKNSKNSIVRVTKTYNYQQIQSAVTIHRFHIRDLFSSILENSCNDNSRIGTKYKLYMFKQMF